jgi:nucleoside-diphosphate-sugar epimerase
VEAAPAGSVLHAVDDEGVPTRDIAEAIARQLGIPAVSVAPDEAGEHFGWLAPFLGADAPASSVLTRELVGWQPTGPGLLADLNEGHYVDV